MIVDSDRREIDERDAVAEARRDGTSDRDGEAGLAAPAEADECDDPSLRQPAPKLVLLGATPDERRLVRRQTGEALPGPPHT